MVMDRQIETPARQRARWVLSFELALVFAGLVLMGQRTWAVMAPSVTSQPASLQYPADPALSEDFPAATSVAGFSSVAANNAAWTASDITTASVPQPDQSMAMALLGLVTVSIGITCWVSGARRPKVVVHKGITRADGTLTTSNLSPDESPCGPGRYDWPEEI
jgi:hypothetical protein